MQFDVPFDFQDYHIGYPDVNTDIKFTLPDDFISMYASYTPPFGFNGLGQIIYRTRYSRPVPGLDRNERWFETVRRVVEGTFSIQKRHAYKNGLPFSEAKAQQMAKKMYNLIFTFKFTPPGRGLWAMGTELTEKRGTFMSLQNCAFTSSRDPNDPTLPYAFMMDASMLGVGVGFDTKGTHDLHLPEPGRYTYRIPDSREGWVNALRLLMHAYFTGQQKPEFIYDDIRPAGEPIKGFGGTSSGAGPLRDLLEDVDDIMAAALDKEGQMTIRSVTDVMNLIGRCVIAGNVRRTAQISFGSPYDETFLDLKDYEKNPERQGFGWASNNSIFAELGMDYTNVARRTQINGEPGYAWMENVRKYGRMGELMEGDEDAAGFNPCVTGDTPILTRQGYKDIATVVGETVQVWNGEEFALVKPRITGHNQPILQVQLSDGSHLRCTPYHEFLTVEGRKQAIELAEGDKMEKFDMPVVTDGESIASPYTQGFFAGDGQGTYTKSGALLYGEKKELFEYLDTPSNGHEISNGRVWVSFPNIEKPKFYVPTAADINSRLRWLEGLVDADGCTVRNPNSVGVQIASNNPDFLKEIRLMLTTLGVQAKVRPERAAGKRELPDGNGGSKLYDMKAMYRLLITATDVKLLQDLGFSPNRLDLSQNNPNRDARRFVTVETVEYDGQADTVYCFTEPKTNRGTFAGIVTGQCVEQPLHDKELCTLVETYPFHHDSIESYKETLKYAYLYGKTVTLTRLHWAESNRVMQKNRRIGTSATGITQFLAERDIDTLRRWLDKGYDTVQYYDDVYSEYFGVPKSVRTTSVKPSGTVSLLAGATPGMHFPEASTYIRRVRFAKDDDILPVLRDAGYPMEPAESDPENTVVVEFVVDLGDVRSIDDVTMYEQISLAMFMQRYWADNAVSCTVTFDPETEGDQIADALRYAQYGLKAISLLPRFDGGAYAQMPYEAISKEEYDRRDEEINLDALDFSDTESREALGDKYCDSDGCIIL